MQWVKQTILRKEAKRSQKKPKEAKRSQTTQKHPTPPPVSMWNKAIRSPSQRITGTAMEFPSAL
jgi:hypothetical protein